MRDGNASSQWKSLDCRPRWNGSHRDTTGAQRTEATQQSSVTLATGRRGCIIVQPGVSSRSHKNLAQVGRTGAPRERLGARLLRGRRHARAPLCDGLLRPWGGVRPPAQRHPACHNTCACAAAVNNGFFSPPLPRPLCCGHPQRALPYTRRPRAAAPRPAAWGLGRQPLRRPPLAQWLRVHRG